MKRHLLVLTAVSAFVLTSGLKAETATTTTPANTTEAVAPVVSESKPMAAVDLRPSWTSLSGEMHMENSLLAGYKFNSKVSTYGVYNFQNNLFNPAAETGLDLQSIDLSVRTKVGKVYTEPSTGIVFSYENRIYGPITQLSRDKGMVAAVRNYFVATKSVSDSLKLMLYEIPIIHLYQAAGSVVNGKASANPWFENRVYLVASLDITSKLNLAVPLYFHASKFRDFAAGAAKNDAWDFFVYTYPELTYAVNDNVSVGAAYYSDNLVVGDMSDTSLSAGLEKGVFQVFVSASI